MLLRLKDLENRGVKLTLFSRSRCDRLSKTIGGRLTLFSRSCGDKLSKPSGGGGGGGGNVDDDSIDSLKGDVFGVGDCDLFIVCTGEVAIILV